MLPQVPCSLFVPRARWGGMPVASRAGNEMIPPPPAMESTNPANSPASHSRNSEASDNGSMLIQLAGPDHLKRRRFAHRGQNVDILALAFVQPAHFYHDAGNLSQGLDKIHVIQRKFPLVG
jgi:hypothetical protein